MAQWKNFDAEIRDYILKFLCRKTLFNAQLDRIYPNIKPSWYTDIYCHSCKEQNVMIPETCYHAMVDCPAVRAARDTTNQYLNIAVRPTANSSEDSILWTKNGEVLGPSRTKSTLSLINAILWLTSVEILKSKFKKEIPCGEIIAEKIKNTMKRLSKKNEKNQLFRDFQNLTNNVYQLPRPPES